MEQTITLEMTKDEASLLNTVMEQLNKVLDESDRKSVV